MPLRTAGGRIRPASSLRGGKTRMKKFLVLIFVLILLASLPIAGMAAPNSGTTTDKGDVVLWGQKYRVEAGKTIDGDLVLVNCTTTVEQGATINGDVVLAGGTATMEKDVHVNGDIAMIGASLHLKGVTVNGDLSAAGGIVELTGGTRINGDLALGPSTKLEGTDYTAERVVEGPNNLHFSPPRGLLRLGFSPLGLSMFHPVSGLALFWGLVKFTLSMLFMLLLGVAVAAIWPDELQQMGETSVRQLIPSLGVGFLALILGFPLGLVMIVLILLIPFGLLLWLLLIVLAVVGWLAIGYILGHRILTALSVENPVPILSVAVGVILLALLGKIPCIGWAVTLVAVMTGTGAAILTRLGTREYGWNPIPGGTQPVLPAPPPEPGEPPSPTPPGPDEPPAPSGN